MHAYFLDLSGGGDGALVRPRPQRRHETRLDDLGDGPERAGAVDGCEDEPAEPGVLAALDVDHAGEAHELRRGPADAEGAVLGGLEDELVGRRRADEDGRRAKEVRSVHAHVRLSHARPRRFLRLAARARSPRPPDGPTLLFRLHRRRTQSPAAC